LRFVDVVKMAKNGKERLKSSESKEEQREKKEESRNLRALLAISDSEDEKEDNADDVADSDDNGNYRSEQFDLTSSQSQYVHDIDPHAESTVGRFVGQDGGGGSGCRSDEGFTRRRPVRLNVVARGPPARRSDWVQLMFYEGITTDVIAKGEDGRGKSSRGLRSDGRRKKSVLQRVARVGRRIFSQKKDRKKKRAGDVGLPTDGNDGEGGTGGASASASASAAVATPVVATDVRPKHLWQEGQSDEELQRRVTEGLFFTGLTLESLDTMADGAFRDLVAAYQRFFAAHELFREANSKVYGWNFRMADALLRADFLAEIDATTTSRFSDEQMDAFFEKLRAEQRGHKAVCPPRPAGLLPG
jgi:hypothetical protein